MGTAFDPVEGRTQLVVRPTLGLRYVRQLNLIDVPLDTAALDATAVPRLLAAFRERYERLVGEGTSNAGTPIEVVRVAVSIASTPPDIVPSAPPIHGSTKRRSRRAWFAGREVDCDVHAWGALSSGSRITGPAFIESEQTTVVVYDGQVATIDDIGNVHLTEEAP
jgi:N-methylhydantoinase A